MITIQELLFSRLEKCGVESTDRIKLVRQKDARQDLYELYRHNKEAFLNYQSAQSKPVFDKVDYIVSFIGEEGTSARFIGVYKIVETIELNETDKPSGVKDIDNYFYKMQELPGFDDMKERVIISWSNAIKWHQWYKKRDGGHRDITGIKLQTIHRLHGL